MAGFERGAAPTWEEIKGYLSQKFKVSDTDRGVRIIFDTDKERSQLVVVQPVNAGETLYANLLSRIGNIPTSRLPQALDFMAQTLYGSLVYSGGDYFFKITLDMTFTPFDEMSSLIMFAAKVSDDLEKEFVGGDEN